MKTEQAEMDGQGGLELVADSVLSRLREGIMAGDLAPGAKISEPEVARRLGVSRAPLREALRRLEERGLVTRTPRLGARVVVLSPEKIQQIFVVREAIEGMAARLAATHITDDEIVRLRAQLEHQRARSSQIGAVQFLTKELDNDFHSTIVEASRNEFLIRALREDYRDLINLCRVHQRHIEARAHRALVEHSRIVDALEERDPDLAELMMRRHVASARKGMQAQAIQLEVPEAAGSRR
ncbi:GntR family transcriptional regulator [Chitinasiproducens palmae]|uniref:DNA-binding transcriptional regulator, GntR family n=1 Tax=Chitinasiproducens palmae TaxID=1770053 RepID=A0A1H2PPL7_9BURK|nr:GntR family transcriptional regulator [Chitinasiproducens palmae]SDV48728.1 DNA-binding transcriptional regulator, GntR family [Chitinasiproducens palmae]